MSKKLLNEGTIRRFMKLAALKPIADEVISEMAMDYKRDDEPMEEGYGEESMEEMAHGDKEPMEEEVVAEEAVTEEEELEMADEEEMAVEEEPAEEAPAGDHEDLLRRVVQAVAAELDVDVEIEDDAAEAAEEMEMAEEEPAPEEEMEMGMELADEEEAAEMPLEEEAPIQEEDSLLEDVEAALKEAGIEVVDEQEINEALVKKVSARVVQRLLKEFA